MPLYPILLVAIIAVADGGAVLHATKRPLGDGWTVMLSLAPLVLLAAVAWVSATVACRRRRRPAAAMLAANRVTTVARWLIVGQFAVAVIVLGWLDDVRRLVGDLVLIDELLALSPALLAMIGLWWGYYPIERRLREAVVIRRLDNGQPVYPIPARGAYVLAQTRSGLLLLLVPILLILASTEAIELMGSRGGIAPGLVDAGKYATALAVFVVSPLIARLLLSVRPLAEGEVRASLLNVCRRHGVRVRDILLWDTSGTMINAAVMGLLGSLRYVLLTDALLESMDRADVEAVMAHEVAHVRRRHLPWMILTLVAAFLLATLVPTLPFVLLEAAGWIRGSTEPPAWVGFLMLVGEGASALLIFGWISRRFERQADAFAVQHLSGLGERADGHIDAQAVAIMQGALGRIAQLSAIDPRRRSWRHGSIAWRQAYLASIVGHPLGELAIDRLVGRIKVAAALVIAASVAAQAALSQGWVVGSGSVQAATVDRPQVAAAPPVSGQE